MKHFLVIPFKPKLGSGCKHRFHPFKTRLQKSGPAYGGGSPSWRTGITIKPWKNHLLFIWWRPQYKPVFDKYGQVVAKAEGHPVRWPQSKIDALRPKR